MKKSISIISSLFVIGIGTLNHFMYDWFPFPLVGIFTPVNESIFEHLKLVFYPFLITIIIRFFFINKKDYFVKAAVSSIAGIITIPILYYLIKLFVNPTAIVNIIIFILACLIQEFCFYKLINKESTDYYIKNPEGVIVILSISLAFSVLTFNPPKIELFLDPSTKTYGIYNEK
jgi:hypothetical protein